MNTGFPKPDIERIKPPKWSIENTAATQKVVNELAEAVHAVRTTIGHCPMLHDMVEACKRFRELDPKVHVPGWMLL